MKPTKDINYTLVACGLQEWAIQQKEDSTLAKIAILYTLALAAKEYSDENRKISREVMEKAGRDELSKINCLINNGITTFPRVEIARTQRAIDKLTLVANAASKSIIGLTSYISSKTYFFLRILEELRNLKNIQSEVEHSGLQDPKIRKKLKACGLELDTCVGDYISLQPDDVFLNTVGILGVQGNMIDPNETTSGGVTKFEDQLCE